jgi:hypothetical protein
MSDKSDKAWELLFILLGSGLSILGGIWADWFNRGSAEKAEFRAFIGSKISDIPTKEFADFYRRIKLEIKPKTERLKVFLRMWGRRKICVAWEAFDAIDQNDLDDQYEKDDWGVGLYQFLFEIALFCGCRQKRTCRSDTT